MLQAIGAYTPNQHFIQTIGSLVTQSSLLRLLLSGTYTTERPLTLPQLIQILLHSDRVTVHAQRLSRSAQQLHLSDESLTFPRIIKLLDGS